ncbi:MAG: PRC and DUF2382 domain-containing protein [Saccharopolyspora sp.]|uniref:PRC and DUF2382 domain-containing protein n=1 Tax=Saccharopolyspora sp. TaxID=33915 RepID=UPI0025CD7F3B|nr:PRC and DUF2382 domain-containing protein [Saccharopolyspora sp.]MBQ6639993.1 PRC and DUF2382 domain-containing protein [Saccharopolyspora sp.]
MTNGTQQQQRLADLPGQTVYDSSGQKIGKIGQIWHDETTGKPEWTTVQTGMFGNHESFLPMDALQKRSQGQLQTPHSKEQVRDAPRIDPAGEHLDSAEEERLYSHYGNGTGRGTAGSGAAGQDTSGPTTDEAMTRSEEHLRAGTERRESGRVRLRKYVVTETEQITVPVSHEEVRIEREPITEANRDEARSGPAISEEEHEVTLHEERPVTGTETVPKERVRMSKDRVDEDETVSGEVRKEHIDTDSDIETNRR